MMLHKTDTFVPFSPAKLVAENRDFKVISGPPAPAKPIFKSLDETAAAHSAMENAKNCEPQLSVQRDGDRITHLRVQCSCGQIMELACVYDEAAKNF